jgi:hypothetical protein
MMLKTQLQHYDDGAEPAPRFASDADIKLADQLRHQLEERYFGAAASPAPWPGSTDKTCR